MQKKFCVIGAQVASKIDRTWFEEEGGAVAHAEGLARKSFRSSGGTPVTLYVVEVRKIVECGMPQVTTRDPTEQDVAEAQALEDD